MPDVPSWQEMESLTSGRVVPTVEEMASGKKPKAKKPKALCKYGPRGADGLCPKKPSASSVRGASTGTSSRSVALQKSLDPTKLLVKVGTGAVNEGVKTAVRQVIPKLAASKKERAAIIRGGVAIGKEAVAKAAGTLAGFGTALAALPAASVAAISAAGISAFLGTQYLRNLWDKHQNGKMLDKATRNRNARILWTDAVAELERREKRESTRDERLALYNLFYEDKKT